MRRSATLGNREDSTLTWLRVWSKGAVKDVMPRARKVARPPLSMNVMWNNAFRRIFNCCWRQSVSSLLYYCIVLPMSVDQRRIVLEIKTFTM